MFQEPLNLHTSSESHIEITRLNAEIFIGFSLKEQNKTMYVLANEISIVFSTYVRLHRYS